MKPIKAWAHLAWDGDSRTRDRLAYGWFGDCNRLDACIFRTKADAKRALGINDRIVRVEIRELEAKHGK
jgi:hypothetical protein